MGFETKIPPFMTDDFMKQFKFPDGYLETLMSMVQLNAQLMNSTQQITMETSKSVMNLQQQYLKRAFDQWNEQIQFNISKAPIEEKTARQADITKETINQISKHAQELSAILAKSNEKLSESFKDGFDKSFNIVKKTKE